MDKSTLRRGIRQARSERADRDTAARALAIAFASTFSGLSEFACYVALPTEPPTAELLTRAWQDGQVAWLPRIVGAHLDWARCSSQPEYSLGPMGVMQPTGSTMTSAVISDLPLLLIPALAVSRGGARLGQGGGFYDRMLESIPSFCDGGPRRVAVVFGDEVLDELPTEPHDQLVDAALTPGGLISLR